MIMKRLHIFVYGDVQGVFFRANTVSTAKGFGLKGWVRNRRDGSVEIVAEGKQEKLIELLEWCKKGGPASARVDKVTHKWEEPTEEFDDFVAKETA